MRCVCVCVYVCVCVCVCININMFSRRQIPVYKYVQQATNFAYTHASSGPQVARARVHMHTYMHTHGQLWPTGSVGPGAQGQ
jgi:hypothetical protein